MLRNCQLLVATKRYSSNHRMKQLLLLFTLTIVISCGHVNNQRTENGIHDSVALTFINDYALQCSSVDNDSNWIRNHSLLTEQFKNQYYTLLDSAAKLDPELGLGFDPIFDAQDFPDSGFVVLNSNPKTGFVTVKGKEWPQFELVLKVLTQNNNTLVDGCGIINIPENLRAKR